MGEDLIEVARFEHAGDVRVMLLGERDDGALILEERLEGPSVGVAYGRDRVRLRLTMRRGSASALERFAREEANDILDLMDRLDKDGVDYEFASEASDNVLAFRPRSAARSW